MWRSEVYGSLKDGWSLTPLATLALLEADREAGAARRGVAWLAGSVKDGRIVTGAVKPAYPAYTAALTVMALSFSPADARSAWVFELRSRQLDAALGWSKSDVSFGGWGYSTALPKKGGDEAFLESNLSATAFALDALAAVGVPAESPAYENALVFVERQQNFASRDPGPEDDGGFYFVPGDDVRNKAGAFGDRKDAFHSYGSMTADGLRSLLRCGGNADRIAAARKWLLDRFDAKHHPGTYRAEREEVRDSAWFYWAASLAATIRLDPALASLKAPLRDELLRRQRADGSWQNELTAVREDDPVIATSFALRALAALQF